MKHSLITHIVLFFASVSAYSQVGINTVEPKATLHIAGDVIIDTVEQYTRARFLAINDTGSVGVKKQLIDFKKTEAIAPSDYTTTNPNSFYTKNVPLGLNVNVQVPANTTVLITVYYHVPMGLAKILRKPNAYLGTTFYINNTEIPSESYKFSLGKAEEGLGDTVYEMGNVAHTYYEIIDNSTASPINYNYEVKGRIEQGFIGGWTVDDPETIYRFNMWSATGNNYGWGKGFISCKIESL